MYHLGKSPARRVTLVATVCCLAICACTLLGSSSAIAASTQALPGGDAPGRIEKRFQTPALPQSEVQQSVPEARPSSQESDNIHFTLVGVQFEGADHPADFLPLYASLQGKDVTLTQVYALANAVTAKLHQQGDKAAQAVVPAQRIRDGIVHIRIMEGAAQ